MTKRLQEALPTHRTCAKCHRPIAASTQGDLCPTCLNDEFYREIKEYIQENDVTELEVAEKFNLPLSQIKEWIKDGRLVYKSSFFHSED